MVVKDYWTGLIASEKPVKFEDLNNGQGTIHYNHNIQEILVINGEDGSQEVTDDPEKANGKAYKYDCVRVEFPKTGNNVYRTLLNAKYDSDHQEKLINDYQSYQLGITEDEEALTNYKAFLQDRLSIKAMVDEDCKEGNVPLK